MKYPSWDVFCRVVDNYGDAAVCWRLAWQLAHEHGLAVRLWIDRPEVLHALRPDYAGDAAAQCIEGVEVRRWDATAEIVQAADVVIDAFGGGLPDAYAEAMAARSPRALWITLEYLSAEPWVASHHGLPSPHPRLPLERYFFFPGFAPDTGGLLKEHELDARRVAFQRDPLRHAAFWGGLGFDPVTPQVQSASLFGYENPAAPALLDAWAKGPQPMVAAIPQSRLRPQLLAWLEAPDARDGDTLRLGALEVRLLPFLPQGRYDELLWCCDWNFVRGEDSFVRAQWAERPLVWHIYPQDAGAHLIKLDAFLDHYTRGLEPAVAAALRALWHGWNGGAQEADKMALADAWGVVAARGDTLVGHAQAWAARVSGAGDMAGNLVQFCQSKVK
jgi:uncharacterized repeat protein (TIGR03837 family)